MGARVNRAKRETFANTNIIHVDLDIRSEFWQELKTICEKYGWDTGDGVPVILAIGLLALETLRRNQSNEKNNKDTNENIRIASEVEQDNEHDFS